MVYHHINEAHKYISSLGVKLTERAIPATVHYNDDDNAFTLLIKRLSSLEMEVCPIRLMRI